MTPKRAELPWAKVAGRAQAAGYADWLAADEAALDYIATRITPLASGKPGPHTCATIAALAI